MITQQEDRSVIRSGEFREQHFKLAQNAHIFKILRDGIYSDKPLAVIREYWANARDEHYKKGRADLPVDIILPSHFEPYLKIRDYGVGLTRKEVEDIYITYGESTKTNSNDFIGALGIGSKSAFCYTSAFQVTSSMNGKASIYSCYIDETEMGKIAHVDTTDTTEPDGVEISVPINTSDFDLFKSKVRQLFLYAKQRPNIKGDMYFKFDAPLYVMEGKTWAVLGESAGSFCIMGDVPYQFDKNAFISTYPSVVAQLRKQEQVNQEVEVEEGTRKKVNIDSVIKYPLQLPEDIRRLLEFDVLLRFNIGEIEMAASRETLSYKSKTIIGIFKQLEVMLQEIDEKAKQDAAACQSIWDVKKLWAKYFESGAEDTMGKVLRALNKISFRWNSQIINDSEIDWYPARILLPVAPRPTTDSKGNPITDPAVLAALTPPPPPEPIECLLFKRKSNLKLEKIVASAIEITQDQTRIIINDTGSSRGVFTSMNALIPRNYDDNYNYVFTCINKENLDSLVKLLTDAGAPIEYLSKIEIPKADRVAARTGSPKYSKKFFVFNNKDYVTKDSDYWDIAEEIDPEEDEGIYVTIDRYIPQFAGSSSVSSLKTLIKFIESIENKPLTVYGVKTGAVEKLGNNWTKLEKYCNEVGARVMNDINYDQVLADYTELEGFTQEQHILEMFLGIYKWGKDYLPPTAKMHDFHKPIRAIIDNHKRYKEKAGLADMMRIIGTQHDSSAQPTCRLDNVLNDEFLKEYPMLRHTTRAYKHFCDIGEKKQFLLDAATYVRTVELTR